MHWTPTKTRRGRALAARAALTLVLVFTLLGTTARAQVAPVPNSGCFDGSSIGTPLYVINDQAPMIGNLTFAVGNVCPFGATAAFFTAGPCELTPLRDWPLADPCFSNWAMLPPSCGWAWDQMNLQYLDGGLARQDGKVTMAFPIPDLMVLMGVTRCFQFICVDLNSSTPCIGISAGMAVTFQ